MRSNSEHVILQSEIDEGKFYNFSLDGFNYHELPKFDYSINGYCGFVKSFDRDCFYALFALNGKCYLYCQGGLYDLSNKNWSLDVSRIFGKTYAKFIY